MAQEASGPRRLTALPLTTASTPEPVLEHGEIGVIVAQQIAHEPDVVEIDDGRLAAAIGLRGVGPLQRRSPPACQ